MGKATRRGNFPSINMAPTIYCAFREPKNLRRASKDIKSERILLRWQQSLSLNLLRLSTRFELTSLSVTMGSSKWIAAVLTGYLSGLALGVPTTASHYVKRASINEVCMMCISSHELD